MKKREFFHSPFPKRAYNIGGYEEKPVVLLLEKEEVTSFTLRKGLLRGSFFFFVGVFKDAQSPTHDKKRRAGVRNFGKPGARA